MGVRHSRRVVWVVVAAAVVSAASIGWAQRPSVRPSAPLACGVADVTSRTLLTPPDTVFGSLLMAARGPQGTLVAGFPMAMSQLGVAEPALIRGIVLTRAGQVTRLPAYAPDSGLRSPRGLARRDGRFALVSPLPAVHKFADALHRLDATALLLTTVAASGQMTAQQVPVPFGYQWDEDALSNAVEGQDGGVLVANTAPFGGGRTRWVVHHISPRRPRTIEVVNPTATFGRAAILTARDTLLLAVRAYVPGVGIGIRLARLRLSADSTTAVTVTADSEGGAKTVDRTVALQRLASGLVQLAWMSVQRDTAVLHVARYRDDLTQVARERYVLASPRDRASVRSLHALDDGDVLVFERTGTQVSAWVVGRGAGPAVLRPAYQGAGVDLPVLTDADQHRITFLVPEVLPTQTRPTLRRVRLSVRCRTR